MRTTFPWRPLGLTALALGLALSTGLACSKSSDPVTQAGGSTLATIGTQPPATELATKAAPPCSIEVVQPLASGKYPGIEVTDLICSNTAAVATLKGPGAPGGDGVAFFVVVSGGWELKADGPAADADALRPANVGTSLVEAWRDKRNPPVVTTRAPGSGGESGSKNPGDICRQIDDNMVCETTTTTTAPPTTTTTTAPPPTEPPPTEPPPTDPPTSEAS